jgi:hypothetical protein
VAPESSTASAGTASGPSSLVHGRACLCFWLLVAGWYAVVGTKASLSQWTMTSACVPMAEALAWHSGRLDLPQLGRDALHQRGHDTAWVRSTGKVYNVYPPLLTFICYTAIWFDKLISLPPTAVLGPVILVVVVVTPLLIIGFWAFRTAVGSPVWGAVLTFAWLASTANVPLTVWSRDGNVGFVHHLLAQTGVMLLVGDLLGKRRMWPAAIGLAGAAWSRQLTIFYALPMLLIAWTGRRALRDTMIAVAGIVTACGVLMLMSYLKFGSPFETGYRLIYEGRTDTLALRAQHGLFALRWLPDNLRCMIWQWPDVSLSHQGLSIWGHSYGNSLVFTTPVILVVLLSVRQWWRQVPGRWLMISTIPIVAGALTYHAPGFISTGCYRFGMDYLPVWFTVAGPALISPRWRGWTLGLTAWSLVYFQLVEYR